MSNYYCLVAGLPEIHLDDQKLPYSVAEFIEEVSGQLSKKDSQVISIFRLQYDHQNLLSYLKDKDATLDLRGNYSPDQIQEMVKHVRDGDVLSKEYPAYFNAFLEQYFQEKTTQESLLLEDVLSSYYYEYALKSSHAFVAKWYEFNLNLNNLLIASQARKYGFDADQMIIGSSEVAYALRNSSARDWGLAGDLEYVEAVQRLSEEKDIQDRERKIDQLKWEWLEEASFFHYFSVERVFVYLLRLELLERWQQLNKEAGEANLRQMIARLKEGVELPEDYQNQ